MFQSAQNCKKCPSVEQATVCPNNQHSQATNDSQLQQSANLNSLNPIQAQDTLKSVSNGSRPIFFGSAEDDRSTLNSKAVHPLAKVVILGLLAIHSLSQTPGIGSSGQSISQFVISNGELSQPSNGLKFS